MTKEQLFKAELSDLLKEYGVNIIVQENHPQFYQNVRGINFYKPFLDNSEQDIDFTLLGFHFNYTDLEVK